VSHARFFAPAASASGDLVTLPDDEAEHLTRVLRLSSGDRVRAFNGRGAEFEAIVGTTDRGGVRLQIGEPATPAPEPRITITLAQAVLKGDKMDEVVRDAVMIGVAAIQPILSARTESSVASLARGRRRQRWERIAVSSAKQCGRAVVPPILDPKPFAPEGYALLGLPSPVFMLVEPDAASGLSLGEIAPPTTQASIIVGPEGGWTSEEVQAVAAIGQAITLGRRTLRADAMALVAIAALFARWQEF
jgi:16S rRNA (uracil1498-N3)-methyltransferase